MKYVSHVYLDCDGDVVWRLLYCIHIIFYKPWQNRQPLLRFKITDYV
jgi:hypothetical protein